MITLRDSSDGHAFGASVLLFGNPLLFGGGGYAFAGDGEAVTLNGAGGQGTIALGQPVLAGTADGTVPLRPLSSIRLAGGSTGLPWKAGVISLAATTNYPATADQQLLVSVLTWDGGGTIQDLGDGRALIQGPQSWTYYSAYVVRDGIAASGPAGGTITLSDNSGFGGTGGSSSFGSSYTPSSAVGTGAPWQALTSGANLPGDSGATIGFPVVHRLAHPCAIAYPGSMDRFAIGRLATGQYAWNGTNFGSISGAGFAPGGNFRLACSFQYAVKGITQGQNPAQVLGWTSLKVRLGQTCRDPGLTGHCTDPAGLPGSVYVSPQGYGTRFDSVRSFDAGNISGTSCGSQAPASPRPIAIGWGWEIGVPPSDGYSQIIGGTANVLATVAVNQAYGWYVDTDISSILSQVAPINATGVWIGAWVSGTPIDYPGSYPAAYPTFPAPAAADDGRLHYAVDSGNVGVGFWQILGS